MILEYISELELLNRFSGISENVINKFYNAGDTGDFQNEYLISTIPSKLKGEVAFSVTSNSRNWKDLNNALTINIELTELNKIIMKHLLTLIKKYLKY